VVFGKERFACGNAVIKTYNQLVKKLLQILLLGWMQRFQHDAHDMCEWWDEMV